MSKLFTSANFWQSTTSALFGVMASIGTLWASGQFDTVTRADVSEMIARQAPYIADRNLILSGLKQNTDDLKSLIHENKRLGEQVSRLIGTIEARGLRD